MKQIVITTVLKHFALEDAAMPLDFYHLQGNTIKPMIRGRETEGVQLPVGVRMI